MEFALTAAKLMTPAFFTLTCVTGRSFLFIPKPNHKRAWLIVHLFEENLYNLFLIGVGGFIGTVLRYLMSGLIQQSMKDVSLPYGTLFVNLAGCFAAGFLSYLIENYGFFPGIQRQFVFIGILGGFTTFSAFMNESMHLAMDREAFLTTMYIALHIILGLLAIWLGRFLAYKLWR
jgi:fluoride exporter